MAESDLVLLGWWPSMFATRAKIALAEKGIQYEYIEEDLPNNKSPLLLKLNPVHKKVPVLIHHGKPVCESGVIVEYIDETWKEGPPLMPADAYLRAQARFWVDYLDKKIFNGGREVTRSRGERLKKASNEFVEALKVLEGQLGEKPYFTGDNFGFVDVALISYHSHLRSYEAIGEFSIENECPKLAAWAKRCVQRASVSKSLADPHKILEATMVARNSLG